MVQCTALFFEYAQGHPAIVQLLLEHDVDLSTQSNGRAALSMASSVSNLAFARVLFGHNSNVNTKLINKDTASTQAFSRGHVTIFTLPPEHCEVIGE